MSIGTLAVSEAALAALDGATSKSNSQGSPPPKRTLVVTSDTVTQPEPR